MARSIRSYNLYIIIGALVCSIGNIISWSSYDWVIFNWIVFILCYSIVLFDILSYTFLNLRKAFTMVKFFVLMQLITIFIFKKLLLMPKGFWEIPIYKYGIVITIVGIVILFLASIKNLFRKD